MAGIPIDPTDPTTQTSGKPPRQQDEVGILRDLQNRVAALERGRAQAEGMTFISPDGKTTKTLSIDNQGNFVLGPNQKLKALGQYSFTGLSIPGNGNQNVVINDATNLNLSIPWHVFGFLAQNPGGWMDHCSWAVLGNTISTITISIANNGTNTATGQAYFYVFNWIN